MSQVGHSVFCFSDRVGEGKLLASPIYATGASIVYLLGYLSYNLHNIHMCYIYVYEYYMHSNIYLKFRCSGVIVLYYYYLSIYYQ